MKKVDVAWLAGLLEGEGSFFVSNDARSGYRGCLRATLEMSDMDIVERAYGLLGLTTKLSSVDHNTKPSASRSSARWSTTFRWTTTGADAERVMRLILPYMGERRSAKIRECLATPNLSHHPRVTSGAVASVQSPTKGPA